jgi:predicted lipoprotein with Yx(FWY)xxD motif
MSIITSHKAGLTLAAAFAAGAALLAGCSSSSGSSGGTSAAAGAGSTAASSAASSSATTGGPISVATGAAGSYLVDSTGKAIYILTSDKPGGASACTTQCLTFWPPVAAPSPLPSGISGVSAKFATFTAADGSSELTINGYPAYTFANDKGPGTTAGQGVVSFGGTWWLVKPSGSWITTAAASSSNAKASSSASSGGGSGYGY